MKTECLYIAAAASLVPCWSFPPTQASLIPNGCSSGLVLSACANAVYRVYIHISIPPVVRLAPRPQTAGLSWCASSIRAELADMARFTALKAFVQWENRMGVVRGSRTREETLPVNREASAATTPVACAAAPPPASPVGLPIRGAVVPRLATGVPSPPPAAESPSHICAAEVAVAAGGNPTSETSAGVVGRVGWPWCAPQAEPWPGGRMAQLASSANPPLPPVAFNSLS